jgi:hypothetical protein
VLTNDLTDDSVRGFVKDYVRQVRQVSSRCTNAKPTPKPLANDVRFALMMLLIAAGENRLVSKSHLCYHSSANALDEIHLNALSRPTA